TIDVNLKGVFLCCKYVIPHMLRNRGGSIVNIGSINSFMAMENEAVYDASKGGVLMLTRAIALDFAKSNIRANCICPGAIETPLLITQLKMAPDPENYFVGKVQIRSIINESVTKDVEVYLVSFENGARTKIHYHDSDQVLVTAEGEGVLAVQTKVQLDEDGKAQVTFGEVQQ